MEACDLKTFGMFSQQPVWVIKLVNLWKVQSIAKFSFNLKKTQKIVTSILSPDRVIILTWYCI